MRLTAKLMLVFFPAVIILTGLSSYFAVQREFSRFEDDQAAEANRLARDLQDKLAVAWQQHGGEGIIDVVRRDASGEQVQLRWVWLEPEAPDPERPAAPLAQLARAERNQIVSIETRDPVGVHRLHTYRLVEVGAGKRGGLELTGTLTPLDQKARETTATALLSIGALALLGVLVTWGAGVRWVVRPLQQLIGKTRRIGAGDFSDPLHLPGRDELSQLARAMNEMCEQLTQQQTRIRKETLHRVAVVEQLRHADRLKTVGRLAAGLAHELGTPLNVVSGRAALIANGKLTPDEVRESAVAIKTEADRITNLVRQLLDFARRRTPQRAEVDLRDVVRQTTVLLAPLAEKRRVELRIAEVGQPVVACVDAAQIQQVLTNIVMNAVQAMPSGGPVTIRVGAEQATPPDQLAEQACDCVFIAVQDQGTGIRAEDLSHIFEPFFTTKKTGEGTGLGLPIAQGIVQEHGGWIGVHSRPGEGSCLTIHLLKDPPPCLEKS
jgi:two-component system NtrC family sensor kinase